MSNWHLGPLCPFDVESTGVDVEQDRIVSATVAGIKPGNPTRIGSWLIAVDVDIPAGATEVHGITTEYARANGRPAAEVLDLITGELALAMHAGVPVVGMNLAYDFTILDRECRRHRLPTLEDRLGRPIAPVVDALVLDKQVSHRRGKRRLENLCEHYAVRIDGAHNAEFDAMAAARVAYRIAQRHPHIAGMSLAELHAAQIVWRAEQQDSLRAYFDRVGTEHDGVDGSWPVRPFVEQAVLL